MTSATMSNYANTNPISILQHAPSDINTLFTQQTERIADINRPKRLSTELPVILQPIRKLMMTSANIIDPFVVQMKNFLEQLRTVLIVPHCWMVPSSAHFLALNTLKLNCPAAQNGTAYPVTHSPIWVLCVGDTISFLHSERLLALSIGAKVRTQWRALRRHAFLQRGPIPFRRPFMVFAQNIFEN